MTRETRIKRNAKRRMMQRRRRFFCGLIGCLGTFAIVTGIMLSAPSISAQESYMRTVTVRPGDSLWTLVSESCSSEHNIRKIINQVKEINNLDSACLEIGEQLIIPVYN